MLSMKRVLFSVFVAAMSGFLFGYHTAVISGALLFVAPYFDLSISDQGVAVSLILIGAMVGALLCGPLADRVGRKRALFATALLFLLGALSTAAAKSYGNLLLGRFISGLGLGLSSVVAPVYISEISPPRLRGRFVSLYQFLITVGILGAFFVNYLLSAKGEWQRMFAYGAIPAVFQLAFLFFIPESASWLAGRETLKKLPKISFKALISKRYAYVIIIGVLLSIFQQITGINTIIYYAPTVFQSAGFSSATGATLATVGLGIVNVAATLISVFLLDRAGRRAFLLIGTIGMALSLLIFSLSSLLGGVFSLMSLMAYIAFFAIGLGAVTFVMLSEIFPLAIRARAMTLAIFANWLFNYLVSLTFLDFIAVLGQEGTFLMFAGINVVALLFFFKYIPETKGKSLEQLERELTQKR